MKSSSIPSTTHQNFEQIAIDSSLESKPARFFQKTNV